MVRLHLSYIMRIRIYHTLEANEISRFNEVLEIKSIFVIGVSLSAGFLIEWRRESVHLGQDKESPGKFAMQYYREPVGGNKWTQAGTTYSRRSKVNTRGACLHKSRERLVCF